MGGRHFLRSSRGEAGLGAGRAPALLAPRLREGRGPLADAGVGVVVHVVGLDVEDELLAAQLLERRGGVAGGVLGHVEGAARPLAVGAKERNAVAGTMSGSGLSTTMTGGASGLVKDAR